MMTMNKKANPRLGITLKRCATRLPLLLSCAGMFFLLARFCAAGSDGTETEKNSSDSDRTRTLGILAPSATASKPSSTDSKRGARDAQSLAGRSTDEVEAALGKPSGKLQNAQGALWLYSEWRVQVDQNSPVLKGEKDQPRRASQLDPPLFCRRKAGCQRG